MGARHRPAARRRRPRLRARRAAGDRRGRLIAIPALRRFRDAQAGGVYERALAELRAGAKRGHWMWFVFPQLRGLGRSPTAQRYAIASLHEAREYLADPVLGPRLRESCEALLALAPGASAAGVLGDVDALKLRSCVTLFARADPAEPVFAAVLRRYYDGVADGATDELLGDETG